MKISYLVGLIVLAVLPCASASAKSTVVRQDGTSAALEQAWVNHSKMPSPPSLVLLSGKVDACSGHPLGCAEIYNADGSVRSPPVLHVDYAAASSVRRRTFLHELGHYFDAYYLTDSSRSFFTKLTAAAPVAWTAPGPDGYPLQEQFADAYMRCAANRLRPGDSPLSPRRYRAVCRFIRRVK